MIMLARPEPQLRLALGEHHLRSQDVASVARDRHQVLLSPRAEAQVQACHDALRELARSGVEIYGLTTGVGALDATALDASRNHEMQLRLLRSHAAGIGPAMPAEIVRAGMFVRAAQLAKGHSGIQLDSLQAYLSLLNSDFVPSVPMNGSLGASDLCALAQVALLLIGEGRAQRGEIGVSGAEVLEELGLQPRLAWRDAFALIGGPAMSAGHAALLALECRALIETSELALALSAVAESSMRSSWSEALAGIAPHTGAAASAAHLRELLSDSLVPSTAIREALSTRSAFRVLGTAREALQVLEQSVEIEINAGIDNPVVLGDGSHSNNSAAFHCQELAHGLDALGTAMISTAIAAERRVARAQKARNDGEAAFLSDGRGEHAGSMIAHYSAAALVAELRMHATPASIQSMSVSNESEDIAPMTWLASQRLRRIADLCAQVTAIELWTSRRSIAMRKLACPPALVESFSALGGGYRESEDEQAISEQLERVRRWIAERSKV